MLDKGNCSTYVLVMKNSLPIAALIAASLILLLHHAARMLTRGFTLSGDSAHVPTTYGGAVINRRSPMTNIFKTLAAASLATVAMAASAEAACYHKVGDWRETLRETNSGSTLIWLHRGKSASFDIKGVGTGVPYLIACKPDAEDVSDCLGVKFRKNKIILAGVTYVKGCRS
jgi:hypothetical protein